VDEHVGDKAVTRKHGRSYDEHRLLTSQFTYKKRPFKTVAAHGCEMI